MNLTCRRVVSNSRALQEGTVFAVRRSGALRPRSTLGRKRGRPVPPPV